MLEQGRRSGCQAVDAAGPLLSGRHAEPHAHVDRRQRRDPLCRPTPENTPPPPGSFSTRTVARSVWEDEIERRREKNAEAALEPRPEAPEPRRPREPAAPPVDPPARPGPDRQPDKHDEGPTDGKSHITATVYGADWCTPCHQALDHLKRRGVRATFKNIEKDGAAQAEMAAKLKRIGRADGRIPVIDIDGKILVGFSARAIAQALDRAGSGTML